MGRCAEQAQLHDPGLSEDTISASGPENGNGQTTPTQPAVSGDSQL